LATTRARVSRIEILVRRMHQRLFWLATALVFAPCCVRAQTQAAAPVETTSAPTSILRPGDLVKLKIWREPDLSGEFPVGTDGVVVFPKIGGYNVTGETAETLKGKVITAYQRVLRSPSIEFTPLRRVTGFGAVREPGVYPIGLLIDRKSVRLKSSQ